MVDDSSTNSIVLDSVSDNLTRLTRGARVVGTSTEPTEPPAVPNAEAPAVPNATLEGVMLPLVTVPNVLGLAAVDAGADEAAPGVVLNEDGGAPRGFGLFNELRCGGWSLLFSSIFPEAFGVEGGWIGGGEESCSNWMNHIVMEKQK